MLLASEPFIYYNTVMYIFRNNIEFQTEYGDSLYYLDRGDQTTKSIRAENAIVPKVKCIRYAAYPKV